MSVVLHTVTPHGVTRRSMASVEDIASFLKLHMIALRNLDHRDYRHDKGLREALLHLSCDALLDGWLEFAAERARDEVSALTALWAASYPCGQQPPVWPQDVESSEEVAA